MFDGTVFVHIQAVARALDQEKNKTKKEFKKSECTCHWKACSAFSGCFCSSFIHSVCTIYDHAFWGVHWFKRICYKRCYKRIYYPVYDSLSPINHGNVLSGHTRSVLFVLRGEKEKKKRKEKRVSLSVPLWTRLCIRCNLCYISFLFFYDTNTSVVRKKKDFMGEIHLLIKKGKVQPNTKELSNLCSVAGVQREICVVI